MTGGDDWLRARTVEVIRQWARVVYGVDLHVELVDGDAPSTWGQLTWTGEAWLALVWSGLSPDDFARTLIHEVGHVVFAGLARPKPVTSGELQGIREELAGTGTEAAAESWRRGDALDTELPSRWCFEAAADSFAEGWFMELRPIIRGEQKKEVKHERARRRRIVAAGLERGTEPVAGEACAGPGGGEAGIPSGDARPVGA